MAGRYTQRHISPSTLNGLREKPASKQDKKNEDESDFWRFVGDVAPTVGSVAGGALGAGLGSMAGGIGAVPGMTVGSAIGGGLGGIAGGMSKAKADDLTADRENEETDKADRKAALMRALMSMR